VKDFRHKAQDLRVFLRKLIQLREVPRPLRRPGWAYAAGLRECEVEIGGEVPRRSVKVGRFTEKGSGDSAQPLGLLCMIR
jgi:hypothetical protein